MKRRIFIALPISEKLQQEILEWERDLQDLPARWLEGKNLHITLVPPFYADDEEIEKLKNVLGEITGFGSFEIKFSRVTFGTDPRRPRLVWAEGEGPPEMFDLQRKICQVLRHRSERRPLKLHLTLARFRPENFSSFPIKKLDERVSWQTKTDRLVLFESRLSRKGADYDILSGVSL